LQIYILNIIYFYYARHVNIHILQKAIIAKLQSHARGSAVAAFNQYMTLNPVST